MRGPSLVHLGVDVRERGRAVGDDGEGGEVLGGALEQPPWTGLRDLVEAGDAHRALADHLVLEQVERLVRRDLERIELGRPAMNQAGPNHTCRGVA